MLKEPLVDAIVTHAVSFDPRVVAHTTFTLINGCVRVRAFHHAHVHLTTAALVVWQYTVIHMWKRCQSRRIVTLEQSPMFPGHLFPLKLNPQVVHTSTNWQVLAANRGNTVCPLLRQSALFLVTRELIGWAAMKPVCLARKKVKFSSF